MKRRTKAAAFAIMMSIACLSGNISFADTTDLSQHWAYETMQGFLEREEIQRTFKQEFHPDQMITRAEFVELINLLWPGTITMTSDQKNDELTEALPSVETEVQEDGTVSQENEETVKVQKESGSINEGFAESKADVGEHESHQEEQILSDDQSVEEALRMPLTREEAAFLLVSIKKYARESDDSLLEEYLDGDKVSAWAAEAVEIMVQRELLKGYPCGRLCAQSPLTKAEAMTLLKTVEDETRRDTISEEGFS